MTCLQNEISSTPITHPSKPVTCPHAGHCGACTQINTPYADQLATKTQFMRQLFEGHCAPENILPILGMENPYHYRNKVISPFAPYKIKNLKALPPQNSSKKTSKNTRSSKNHTTSKAQPTRILTGMYAQGTHKLINTDGCALENQAANQVIIAIRQIMQRYHMEAYNEDAGTGFIRHAIARVGHESGEMIVTIVTNGEEFKASKAFCKELVKKCPQITTIVQNINTRQTNVILGEKERTLYGPGFILDTLCGLSFRISSHSFYQINCTQTEVLYQTAIKAAGLDGTQTVIDAYCGTGTIGLVAASLGAARVIGVESVPSAVRDARQNALHNGIDNAEFVCEDAAEFLSKLASCKQFTTKTESQATAAKPSNPETFAINPSKTILIMDPPRSGSSEAFIKAASILGPKRIVYISCNPQTQVRDLLLFEKYGYRADYIQPVDMFPHTKHVETVVLMSKVKG